MVAGSTLSGYRLGVDIGGTFTDIVILGGDGTLHRRKILSTPDDYARAIEDGVAALLGEIGIGAGAIGEFAHGTTVATNAIIERRGGRVALITTKGFRDVLELGRFRSPRLYDLSFRKPEPLVERRLRFEVAERIDGQGRVVTPLDHDGLAAIGERILAEGIEAVAICFINAYANPAHEAEAAALLQRRFPALSISVSTQLLPQIQEYERTSTTVVNAYIRPVVERYVGSLGERMARLGLTVPLLFMQSSGGVLPAALVAKNPVTIIESGPAAGVVGAQRLAERLGLGDLIVLDMGGTTAKAAVIEGGRFGLAPETEVGGGAALGLRLIQGAGFVVQVPTIDIAEVGAGGGSIAAVDAGGGLLVGPMSAGAEPGPVCYAGGGTEPTVTDANLLLGYLNPQALVGGDLALDFAAAEASIAGLARGLGLDPTAAAYGIHLIANANMMRALTGVSSERGRDPALFALFAIGGNGPVHAASLAEALRIRRIVVPPIAGLFSALGLLFADIEHRYVTAFYRRLDETSAADFNRAAAPLMAEVTDLLAAEGFGGAAQVLSVAVDIKYVGQMAALPVPLPTWPATADTPAALAEAFARLHEETYGYRSDGEQLQLIALRVVGSGMAPTPRVPERLVRRPGADAAASGSGNMRRAYFGPEYGWRDTPVRSRDGLGTDPLPGPVIIEEYDCTTVVRPGWRIRRDAWDNMLLER
jgi:N-methylhydantoinase A